MGKNLQRACIKTVREPMGHECHPATGRWGKALDPLHQERMDFEFDGDHQKTTNITGVDHNWRSHKVTFTAPKEFEDQGIEFDENPRWHMDQGGNIPNAGEGQSVRDQGFARKRQELWHFSTASMRGCQLCSSIEPFPMKMPRTFILSEDRRMGTGESVRSAKNPAKGPHTSRS